MFFIFCPGISVRAFVENCLFRPLLKMTEFAVSRIAQSLGKRMRPIISKLVGNSPLCPWSSCFSLVDPRFSWRRPSLNISEVTRSEDQVLLSFDNRRFWFPIGTVPNQELWNEYLLIYCGLLAWLLFYLAFASSFRPVITSFSLAN